MLDEGGAGATFRAMSPSPYRLDVVSANLIERLEGARPTWIGDAAAARDGFRRIAAEQVDTVVAEHDELMGDRPWGRLLRREVMETFLPRYTRLALDHNMDEGAGYHAWRRGDPVARVLATFVGLAVAELLYRFTHHPLSLGVFVLALAMPFLPEIRRGWYRRRYRSLLQEVVDDMGRIQDSLEAAPPKDIPELAAEPEPRRATQSASARSEATARSELPTGDEEPEA